VSSDARVKSCVLKELAAGGWRVSGPWISKIFLSWLAPRATCCGASRSRLSFLYDRFWDVVDPDKKEKGNANMDEKDLLAELLSVEEEVTRDNGVVWEIRSECPRWRAECERGACMSGDRGDRGSRAVFAGEERDMAI